MLIAKALQLQAIDLVHIDYKDIEGIRSPDDIEISDELTIGSRCHSYNELGYIFFKSLLGLIVHSEAGSRMGFTGKQVIHPGQVCSLPRANVKAITITLSSEATVTSKSSIVSKLFTLQISDLLFLIAYY